MEYKFNASSLDNLQKVAEELTEIIKEQNLNVLLFTGEMGAGKTTLIKAICNKMEVLDTVTSPTFAIVNEYSTSYGEPIFHFDIYRTNSIDEIIDIGYEEYLYSGNICMIEWWQKMEQLLPTKSEDGINLAEIIIEINTPTSRSITLKTL